MSSPCTRTSRSSLAALVLALLIPSEILAQSEVLLVFGSDTAIWEGMDVGKFHCTYRGGIFTDPARNGHAVMRPEFRNAMRDWYGTPMKLTWWMMAGNIFRFATNTDIPVANTMTMHLMKKFHGQSILQFGDELSLHYHTFAWTDYDADGRTWWNQSHTFSECREDFDVTLAQLLLEEEVFPVSFRSGWHYMDNGWQACLDSLLLYSMHNDYPRVRMTTQEPIDNVYDWSRCSPLWEPFRPSPLDYQISGGSRGWNLRSAHIGGLTGSLIDTLFARAGRGIPQIACFWGHLPENDFLSNLRRADTLVHRSAGRYPAVRYRYCSAREAMQRWRGYSDTIPPVMTVSENRIGNSIGYEITSSEPIYQHQPFVAFKDLYEKTRVLRCIPIGQHRWQTVDLVDASLAACTGFFLTDTMGNPALQIVRHLPRDLYVDDESPGFQEVRGTWAVTPTSAWGRTAREILVAQGDSAIVRWGLPVSATGRYNLFVQIPAGAESLAHPRFRILHDGATVLDVQLAHPPVRKTWEYVLTAQLRPEDHPSLEMVCVSPSGATRRFGADVVRCTPLVREREIAVAPAFIEFGDVSEGDTGRVLFEIQNRGVGPLTVHAIHALRPGPVIERAFPFVVPPMGSAAVPMFYAGGERGSVADTLLLVSDDPVRPELTLPFHVSIVPYFRIVDNDDAASYQETGAWYTSNAQAFGPSSRYAPLSAGTGIKARFRFVLSRPGEYVFSSIVPRTVNAANRALYIVAVNGVPWDSVHVDQNAGSGSWAEVGRYTLPALVPVDISVNNDGTSTGGQVLRADAVRLQLAEGSVSVELADPDAPAGASLDQNFPNPFNVETAIRWSVSAAGEVSLRVFDLLGREVATLVSARVAPGYHTTRFNAGSLASGVYVIRMETAGSSALRRMILLR